MLYLYVLALALGGSFARGSVGENDDSSNLIDISDRLAKIIKQKCLKNADETKYEEVLHFLKSSKNKCWFKVVHKNPNDSAQKLSRTCHAHKPDIAACLGEFGEKLQDCLEPNEQYLKQFIPDAFEKYSQHFCDNIKVLSVTELDRTNTRKCASELMSHPEKDPHKVCYSRSNLFGGGASIGVITKEELCRDLEKINSCYEEIFNEHCADAPELKNLLLGVHQEALTPCAGVV